MTIADRIAIIAAGEIVEQGTPRDIYERPVKRFTAEFIGENNLLDGRVAEVTSTQATVDLGFAKIEVAVPEATLSTGTAVAVSVRSELLQLMEARRNVDGDLQTIPATYVEAVYLGLTTSHLVNLPNGAEVAVRGISERQLGARFEPGQDVRIGWNKADARLHTA